MDLTVTQVNYAFPATLQKVLNHDAHCPFETRLMPTCLVTMP